MPSKNRTFGWVTIFSTTAFFAASIGLSGCATTIKTHPEFNKRHETLKSIAIIPPDAQVYEVTFDAGNQPLPKATEAMKSATADNIKTLLQDKGYEVRDVNITDQTMQSDAALRDAFFEMQTLYKKALEDIGKNKKSSFTYDVGGSASYFGDRGKVDALIVVKQSGTRLSQGSKAAEAAKLAGMITTQILLGVSAGTIRSNYSMIMEVAIIDAKLGDVLWYNIRTMSDNFTNPEDPKVLKDWATQILTPFPDSKFKPKDAVKLPTAAAKKKSNFTSGAQSTQPSKQVVGAIKPT